MSEVQTDNKHPADELAEIRLKIKGWKDREEELRLMLIALPKKEREGSKYTATVTEATVQRLSVPALEEELGDISRFYVPSYFTTVRIKRKKK
jgi:hypothetical protein